jgi:sugar O-acyltransferase (sialic acid O-acetyltransferase NeuD family)
VTRRGGRRTDQLLVIGAGGLGREVAEAVAAINALRPTWDLLGFLDDDEALAGTRVGGLPVLGPVEAVSDYPDALLVVTVGSSASLSARPRLLERLNLLDDRYPSVIHPAATLAASTVVGPGAVVLAGVVTTADVEIGAHVVLMPHVLLTHDDRVGDHATLAGGVRLAGAVRVGECAYLGAGALVREYLTIGASSLVGMGAVVVDDVPPGEVWAGCPAVFLRKAGATAGACAAGTNGRARS